MIPRKLHYILLGSQKLSNHERACIESWKTHCPDFEIIEWSELNFPIEKVPRACHLFNLNQLEEAADILKLEILNREGGIFIEQNFRVCNNLEALTVHSCVVIPKTSSVSGKVLASEMHNPFINTCIQRYAHEKDKHTPLENMLFSVYNDYPQKDTVTTFPEHAFFPYTQETIATYQGQNLGPSVLAVYTWGYSWKSFLRKLKDRLFPNYATKV
jgi:hypothetical protein